MASPAVAMDTNRSVMKAMRGSHIVIGVFVLIGIVVVLTWGVARATTADEEQTYNH